MKKITAIISAIIICLGITACNGDSEISDGSKSTVDGSSSIADNSFGEGLSNVSDGGSGSPAKDPQGKSAEKAQVMYSKEIIPNFRMDEEGCLHYYQLPQHVHDSTIVFEEHKAGEYTVRLLGENARMDEERFPGRIFAWNVSVEVEKDGKDHFGSELPLSWRSVFGRNYRG